MGCECPAHVSKCGCSKGWPGVGQDGLCNDKIERNAKRYREILNIGEFWLAEREELWSQFGRNGFSDQPFIRLDGEIVARHQVHHQESPCSKRTTTEIQKSMMRAQARSVCEAKLHSAHQVIFFRRPDESMDFMTTGRYGHDRSFLFNDRQKPDHCSRGHTAVDSIVPVPMMHLPRPVRPL